MRLNLAEIAMCLGCGPGMVVWDGPSTGEAGKAFKSAPSSIKGLARKRAEAESASAGCQTTTIAPPENTWAFAPWAELICTGAEIDSRNVSPGNLFFCMPGERTDGHDFALAAAKAGARAIIALRNPFPEDILSSGIVPPPVFLVKDVQKALWRLAICHRDTTLARVIGLTGTAGKTSVKEVLAQVLSIRGRTERTHMNLNNQIGLPLSILNASADASFWVMELGISQPHDMDELGMILRPDVALILNVGDGHVEGLGDEGVAAYKSRLLNYIQPGGVAIVSADYPELDHELEKLSPTLEQKKIQLLRFSGSKPDVYAQAEYAGAAQNGKGRYLVNTPSGQIKLETPFRGAYGSENVAAITAVVLKLGISRTEAETGFTSARLPEQRFASSNLFGFTLLDDSYNANLLSSTRMVASARELADENSQSLILVMGEMKELGSRAQSAHEELGVAIAKAAPEMIFWKGGCGEALRAGLTKGGYANSFYPVEDAEAFTRLLEEISLPKAVVLFKGSRSNHLETLVTAFRDHLARSGKQSAV